MQHAFIVAFAVRVGSCIIRRKVSTNTIIVPTFGRGKIAVTAIFAIVHAVVALAVVPLTVVVVAVVAFAVVAVAVVERNHHVVLVVKNRITDSYPRAVLSKSRNNGLGINVTIPLLGKMIHVQQKSPALT
jgi:hypothetical protein|eukprot:10424577-Ditylum_brightwellii.AAC.2